MTTPFAVPANERSLVLLPPVDLERDAGALERQWRQGSDLFHVAHGCVAELRSICVLCSRLALAVLDLLKDLFEYDAKYEYRALDGSVPNDQRERCPLVSMASLLTDPAVLRHGTRRRVQ